jgi:multiple sugar transport system substrate-binding protein
MADWVPEFWDYVRWRGKEWTLPFESSSMVIAYNKTLFARDGVPLPRAGWAWDEFVEAARRLTHAERDEWGYANDSAAWIFRNWLVGNGGTWYQREGDRVVSVINSPAVVEALQRWSDLWLRHRVATLAPPPDGERTGKVAMWTSCVGIPAFKRWGIDFGTTTIPRMQRDASYWCDKALALSRTTEPRQEAAWAFVRWFVQDESYLDWIISTGYLPLTKTQINSAPWRKHVEQNPQYEAHLVPLTRGHLFGVPLEPAAVAGQLDAPVGAAVQAVLRGEAAPRPALDEAKKQVDDLLAQGIRF